MNIDHLERLAKKATPGPWRVGAYGGIYEGNPGQNKPCIGHCRLRDSSLRENGKNNEDFIAGANPAAILSLIAQHRAALELLSEAADELEGYCDAYQVQLDQGEAIRRKLNEWRLDSGEA